MRKINYTESVAALRDPWEWCRQELARRNMGARELGERIGIPRSTLRQLYNGTVATPNYAIMVQITNLLLDGRNEPISKTIPHNPASVPRQGPSL